MRKSDETGQKVNRLLRTHGLLLLLLLANFSVSYAAGESARPVIELKSGSFRIGAEYAFTSASRRRGLQERRVLAANQGMLFIFSGLQRHCMWSQRTHLPLSVAFLTGDGTIINIIEMPPGKDDRFCAAEPARYALEMNAGWFVKRGIGPGDRISGIEKAPPGL